MASPDRSPSRCEECLCRGTDGRRVSVDSPPSESPIEGASGRLVSSAARVLSGSLTLITEQTPSACTFSNFCFESLCWHHDELLPHHISSTWHVASVSVIYTLLPILLRLPLWSFLCLKNLFIFQSLADMTRCLHFFLIFTARESLSLLFLQLKLVWITV